MTHLNQDHNMRVSQLLMATLKESPNDAEIMSHKLMLRAGLIRKLASGLYTWLPLGLRVLRKVERIIREEMNRIGAQEILMPAVQPAELWQETGRWEQYGPHLLKMTDRHKRAFCFGPTHEEVITDLIRRELKSYKQLPLSLYQIQVKFRDEIRPRFGVMRAREFLMKDAYSFHVDKTSLETTYQQFFQAYSKIFTRLGLTFRAVLADTGNIGGSVSHEFHVLANTGEDLLAYSDQSDYAANVEMAQSLLPVDNSETISDSETLSFVTTPGIKSVDGQANHLKVKTKKILKTLLVRGKTEPYPIVALLVRGDHELNPIKAEKHALVASPFQMISVEEVQNLAHCGPGFVGPKELNIPLIADPAVLAMTNFICGANKEDTHYAGFNWGRDCPKPEEADLRTVQEGDLSPDGKGTLRLIRGIEVGHIFQLGDKYSQAMNATVLDESGQAKTLMMGCYGIGVSRIVAAAIEQHHDDKGIIWPVSMAPFQVILIPIGLLNSTAVKTATETLYQELVDAGIEVLLDDRIERPGVMFADAELIGIPHRVVISEKNLANGNLEYKGRRDTTARMIPQTEIIGFLK
jgi:prolyl-tRNA synthetase